MNLPTKHARPAAHTTERFARVLEENRRGKSVGICSICSANRFVLEAGILQAQRDDDLVLIESTSNQVNQFSGYTGQTPAQFASLVREIAAAMNFPAESIVLGGDHLGPHPWRAEGPSSAMAKATALVRACVLAGYTKIHLDTSMHLAGDVGDSSSPLPDEIVSSRAGDLCRAAEDAYGELPPGSPKPLYVIGTEVPIPGGELLDAQAPENTRIEDLARTVHLASKPLRRAACKRHGSE